MSTAPEPERKAATIVAHDLCRRIVQGSLREGDLLPPEADLIASYGVSRAVLREGLRLLEWDSFVRIRRGAGGGAVVTLPDVRVAARYCGLLLQAMGTTLKDLDQALQAIEPEVVSLIANEKRPALEVLEKALVEEERAPARASEFLITGSHFHELLPTALDNRALEILLGIPRQIRIRHDLAVLTGLTEDASYHRKTLGTHQRVVELIRERRSHEASALWSRHMAATQRALGQGAATTVLDLFHGNAIDFDLTSLSTVKSRRTRIPKGADIVAGELRRRIVTGAIAEGEPIPTERALMEEYGLSRPSVREALRVLEAEHLVQLIRGAHRGGRARRPNIATATWQTGLLMQRRGCTVRELVEAQDVLERCSIALLGRVDDPKAIFVEREGAADRSVVAVLEMFDALGRHVANRTLRSLSAIGRALLRRVVDTGRKEVDDEPTRSYLARVQLSLLRAAGQGSVEGLRSAWAAQSSLVYRKLADSALAAEQIDMFR
jgi:DNA-binding FadR family transcriptional regulator